MIGKIKLHGHFGPSYVDEQGLFHKGIVLLDVLTDCETQLKLGAKELHFSIDSPGGYVDIGKDVYNYMTELKAKGVKIVTIQDGLVGSIATMPFMAGDVRIADERFELFIHNPYQQNVSGDADEMARVAKDLQATEDELRKFYGSFSSIPDSALDVLMKQETGLTAEQCVKFGFATEVKKVPVFNLVNKSIQNKMADNKKDEKSFMEHVKAFFAPETKNEKPKGQIPGTAKKSMVVTLAEGQGAFWVEGEALVEGAAVFMLDDSGQPTTEVLPDNTYGPTENGEMVTVVGGKITAVTMQSQEEPPAEDKAFTKAQVDEAVAKAVEAVKAELQKEINTVKESSSNEILALKKNLKLGIAPKPAVTTGPQNQKVEYKTINQKMAEKRKERAEQLKNR